MWTELDCQVIVYSVNVISVAWTAIYGKKIIYSYQLTSLGKKKEKKEAPYSLCPHMMVT